MTKKRIFKYLVIALTPFVCFMISMYVVASLTGLPGRRGGPQDAFRHTYASAIVGKYIGVGAVKFFTRWTERYNDNPHDLMDRHNNAIGAQLGAAGYEIYPAVAESIRNGRMNSTNPSQSTWLPEHEWSNSF